MTRRTRARLAAFASLVLIAVLGLTSGAAPGGESESGFRALSGEEAAAFAVPDDMELVRTLDLPAYGLTYERYQQRYGDAGAEVLGGQITVYRDRSGRAATVIGAHYPGIVARSSVGITKAAAQGLVDRDIGAAGERIVDLLIDPASGRYFYRVETRRFDSRWVHWIDAESGGVINRFDALAHDDGKGVKGDTKDVNGPDNASTADDLTTYDPVAAHGATGAHWDLFSKDSRQKTYDVRNGTSFLYYVYDLDNHWTTAGTASPGHPALVDAQFYANVTDDYFQGRHNFNWLSCYGGGMQSGAHYSRSYNNAFWNGTYTIYGDGDGVTFREFSGGLDVVAHEHTHGVTDCTSNLVYQDESGALNESFSDILGNSAEFYAGEPTTTNCKLASGQSACADWWIGEDIYLPSDSKPGFRNMADPAEDGDPDHYSERQVGGGDNGGVHSNSGIPNHAYYLLVTGGTNAGCDAVGSDGHSHTANCGVTVTGVGVVDAEKIFFRGFTSLPSNATMCQARSATITQANSLFGNGSQQATSTANAWEAVGVTAALCGGGSTNAPPTASFTSSCSGLACMFDGSGSSDPEGPIASYSWTFGDGSTGAGVTASHTYLSGGTYTVTLTVTDGAAATDSETKQVTVSSSGIMLTARGYKTKGWQKVDLTWGGASSSDAEIRRTGTSSMTTTTPNDGFHTDNINKKGGGATYTYTVCVPGTSTCSNSATVTF